MDSYQKKTHIIGGGTVHHVRPHLALCAPAYGETARTLQRLCVEQSDKLSVHIHLTKMAAAGRTQMETNEDVARLLVELVADPLTKIIYMPDALCDYIGTIGLDSKAHGKHGRRLRTRETQECSIELSAAPKLIRSIRLVRKDIFLVGFKTTCGATEDEQYIDGLKLLKGASCNLVLANDIQTRVNMIVTPEEARYHVTTFRPEVLRELVDMAYLRSHLTFTQSTVVAGEPVPWNSAEVPEALRVVVNHCIKRGAYKPFNGATVGHFAAKIDDTTFLTSRRKTNFNEIDKLGLVKIKTDGPDTVIAYGAKPSVGGQSQRIVFHDHPGLDCIVHFHSPIKLKPQSKIPLLSQREYECGSHQCGERTSKGLAQFGNLHAVYLDQHGPNIVFNRNINPQEVIDFIEANFVLEEKTGGPVS